jgi:hypothetical protein
MVMERVKPFKLPKAKCLRCDHDWIPRRPVIRACPSCNSPYWDKPREREATEAERKGRPRKKPQA